jgi:hypothetical protein
MKHTYLVHATIPVFVYIEGTELTDSELRTLILGRWRPCVGTAETGLIIADKAGQAVIRSAIPSKVTIKPRSVSRKRKTALST